MKTWEYIGTCLFILYICISWYGKGIERGKLAVVQENTEYVRVLEEHRHASEILIDALLMEQGGEPMFNTKSEFKKSYKDELHKELFRQENWLDG